MSLYLRLLVYVRPYVPYMVGSVVCMLILSATSAAIAYLVQPAIDDVFIKKDFSMLAVVPALVVVTYLVKSLADFGQAYLMGYVGNSVITDIREELYRHIQTLSLTFFAGTSTGLLMSRMAGDVDLLQRAGSDSIRKLLRSVFLVIGLTGVVFYQNWQMALFCFCLLPWLFLPLAKFGRKSRKYSRRSQERMAGLSTFLDETITGNQTVKAFCMEEYENRRFCGENGRLLRVNLKDLRLSAFSSPFMQVFGGIVIAGVIYYGGYSVMNGRMTTGELFSFLAAVAMLYKPVKALGRENMRIQKGMAAAVRVFDVLDTVPDIIDSPGAVHAVPMRKSLTFRNVSFGYDEDTAVLSNVSFEARAGEVVAFVGHSGAGKTTVANLILRFYEVLDGGIFIDGVNIRDVSVRSLRDQIAFVTQETILFNDTVRNNIAYGSPDVSQQEIEQAARAAYAYEFISAMEQGYDTVVGEKGVRLSGGQRQRLAIARALVKNAPILILDEATSALDTHSEKEVQGALDNLMQGRMTILIAHRLATVRNADQIVVLDEGKVVERGSHADLINHGGVYNQLVAIQSGYEKKKTAYEHIV
ncbi:MAG: ABC transporter ATP-binding protein [Deltaproteobacteria bacterium]|nr:ABC transporter ATP-binding protein [Deltaproteobacteria bacterium]